MQREPLLALKAVIGFATLVMALGHVFLVESGVAVTELMNWQLMFVGALIGAAMADLSSRPKS